MLVEGAPCVVSKRRYRRSNNIVLLEAYEIIDNENIWVNHP